MKTKKTAGHAEHSRQADTQTGLPGEFPRPLKVTMLGAGSFFMRHLFGDILEMRGLPALEFALVDIDSRRLDVAARLAQRMVADAELEDRVKVLASTDRRKVMAGSHYIISCVEVSGTECVRFDNDIPAKYGVDQCIGDTIGPGGLFKGLRTIPVWLDILRDAEHLCPEALVLNYTNPMNMMCLAAGRVSRMEVVGLCHSVQGTSHLLAQYAGVPYEELDWECAGINHLAWFTRLRHKGRDLYPRLKKQFAAELAAGRGPGDDPEVWDLVRKDMCLHFGAFVTESSGHLSEYLPYYRKRADLLKRYCTVRYGGESGFYAANWPSWRKKSDADRLALLRSRERLQWKRTWEYASWIIEAREKNVPQRIHGNVMNSHRGGGPLIANLPADGCVEVACMIDGNGVNPTVYGKLPPQMAAICASNMRMFDLGATAAIERSKEAAVHALLLDPLTAAVCSPAEIKQMTEELFRAQKKYLPGYK
ncbi:MAG: hypothetical protein N2111_00855 [Candidatus Sumerlaeaceae bacterium]|nr:hypothetical protein [Candidatus Sumerlaeaceae bacterium]